MLSRNPILLLLILLSMLVPATMSANVLYRFGPESVTDFYQCRTVDANSDGRTWQYNNKGPALIYEGCDNDADEYIFLPPVTINETGVYMLSLEVMRSYRPEILEIGFASSSSPAAFKVAGTLSETIMHGYYSTLGEEWNCTRPGEYFPVLHIVSPAGGRELKVRNITVSTAVADQLPLMLTPTVAEAAAFSVIDGDYDGHSWRFDADSLCFSTPGSTARKADDWLLLPPFVAPEGNYSLTFSARAENQPNEIFEVRFGPDSLSPREWTVSMQYPELGKDWQEFKALATLKMDSTTRYRAAIRVMTSGGDGMRVRDFTIQQSADSLLQLPCIIRLDSAYNGEDEKWILLPPFQAPVYKSMTVTCKFRGNGPRPAMVEIWQGSMPDPAKMNKVSEIAGITPPEGIAATSLFYCGDPHGQHFIALHVVGDENRTGGVVESVRLDTLVFPDAKASLPFTLKADTSINNSIIIGPLWFDRPRDMVRIEIAAAGAYLLKAGTHHDPLLMKKIAVTDNTTTVQKESFLFAPQDYGYHYIALLPIKNTVRLDSINVSVYPYSVAVPDSPAISADYHPSPTPSADVSVVLPREYMNGLPLWADEGLAVVVTSEIDSKMLFGMPGDTLTVNIPIPAGRSQITATAGNWLGYSPAAGCEIFVDDNDIPVPVKQLTALPDHDNLGILLQWESDSIGINGWYIPPDSLKYRIELLHDELWQNMALIPATESHSLRLPEELSDTLSVLKWRITGVTSRGESAPATISTLLGKPLLTPLCENFDSGEAMFPWVIVPEMSDSVRWSISEGIPGHTAAKPARCLTLTPAELPASATLLLPTFESTDSLQLRLRLYSSANTPELIVAALSDRQVLPVDTIRPSRDVPGWNDYCIALPDMNRTAITLRLGINWTDKSATPLYLGEYKVLRGQSHEMNLQWRNLSDSLQLAANPITVVVANFGLDTLKLATPVLSCDTCRITSPTTKDEDLVLPPGKRLSLSYIVELAAEAYCTTQVLKFKISSGQTLDSLIAILPVKAGMEPIVVDLTGELTGPPGRVTLSWNKPVCSNAEFNFIPLFTIYLDGKEYKRNISAMEFVDSALQEGTHTYRVAYSSAGHDYGLSNPVSFEISSYMIDSVDGIASDRGAIIPIQGGIVCKNLEGRQLRVYKMDGTEVCSILIDVSHYTHPLSPGTYLLKAATLSLKINIPF